jgi:hypothetical protein
VIVVASGVVKLCGDDTLVSLEVLPRRDLLFLDRLIEFPVE